MSFAAILDDLTFPEILHLIAFNKKSGKLTLTCEQGHALIAFRQGRIIYAASAGLRESFGAILLCRGLISDADLADALDFQRRFASERRLGAILVGMGKVSDADVKEAVKEQALRVIREVMQWPAGASRFEPLVIPEGGEAEVGVAEVLAAEGFDAEGALLEVVTQIDEARGEGEEEEEPADGPGRGEPGRPHRVPHGWDSLQAPRLVSLGSVMREIQSPAFTGEIALGLMRYAAQIADRGVFLVVRGRELADVGRFGVDAERHVRPAGPGQIRIRLTEPSLFQDVIRSRTTYKGPLVTTFWNQRFVELLGGSWPQEVVVIPMTIEDKTAFLFYGDNGPGQKPIGPLQGLEFLMARAALAMERAERETHVMAFRRRREAQPRQPTGGL